MAHTDQLLYLEPDDEITGVVRRMRAADPGRVVFVAPARGRVTSSLLSLRVLAQMAMAAGRDIVLVADAPARSLAAEAGISAFASIAEAAADATAGAQTSEVASEEAGSEPEPSPRAPIRVVRGAGVEGVSRPSWNADDTAVTQATPQPSGSLRATRRPPGRLGLPALRWPRLGWWAAGIAAALLLVAGTSAAILLPTATILVTPSTTAIGPLEYDLEVPPSGIDDGELTARRDGTASGERIELVPASGSVIFYNWNREAAVSVPAGTGVAAGNVTFSTTEAVVVPAAHNVGIFDTVPGVVAAPIEADAGGPTGNVPAGSIDTVIDDGVRNGLRGGGLNPNALVDNPDSTSGGESVTHSVITDQDVGDVVAALEAELRAALEDRLGGDPGRIYAAAPADERPEVIVPEDLVGTEDQAEFTLEGTLVFARPFVLPVDLISQAAARLDGDPDAVPPGTEVLPDSIHVVALRARTVGDRLVATSRVTALLTTLIDENAVRERALGKTPAEVADELADLGSVEVELWPAWVDRVTSIGARVTVIIITPQESAPPNPSSSPGASQSTGPSGSR